MDEDEEEEEEEEEDDDEDEEEAASSPALSVAPSDGKDGSDGIRSTRISVPGPPPSGTVTKYPPSSSSSAMNCCPAYTPAGTVTVTGVPFILGETRWCRPAVV